MNSFDVKLLFLSYLDSYQYTAGGYMGSTLSPAFKFLSAKAAFNISGDNFYDELKNDYFKNLK